MEVLRKIGKVFAVILTIILTVVIIGNIVLFSVTSIVSKQNIKKMITDLDFTDVTTDEDSIESVNTIVTGLGFKEEKVNEVLNSKEVKEVIGSILGTGLENVLKDGSFKLDDEDLKEILDKNFDAIINYVDIPKEDADLLKEDLDANIGIINKELTQGLEDVKLLDDDAYKVVSTLFSVNTKIICACSILVIMLFIFLFSFDIIFSLKCYGVSFIVAGIFNILGYMGVKTMPFNEIATNKIGEILAESLLSNSTFVFMIYGVGSLFIGIIMLVIVKLTKKKNKNDFLDLTSNINIESIKA